MSITRNSFKRPAALFGALAVLVGAVVPGLVLQQRASAAGQVTERFIQLSDSAPSGGSIASGVGSGTAVQYSVSFKAATNASFGGIVVDICGNTPLIGDTTCTYPTGFDWAGGTLSSSTFGNVTGSWSAAVLAGGGGSNDQVLLLTNATPAAPTSMVAPITFTVTGVTNPDTSLLNATTHNYSFYARVLTFDTAANMNSNYTASGSTRSATYSGNLDNGGVALSIQQVITVTARVMESLSLCTAKAAYTGIACAGPTGSDGPSVDIGHGSPTKVLDISLVDTINVYSQLSTNASNGYALYLRGSNACGGLSKDGGTTCPIPAVNSGSSTAAAISAGTAAFGAQVTDGTAVSGGTGANTATARWKQVGSNYMMDTTSSNDNVTSTYGSMIAFTDTGDPKQANGVNNTITFGATASSVTAAGIYTQNFSLIGVGTF